MNWRIFTFTALCAAACAPAFAAPVTAAEVDLLFRMGTPAADVVREVQERGLLEPLNAAQKAKFAAGGVAPDIVQRIQNAVVPAAATAKTANATPPVTTAVQSPSGGVKWPKVGEQYLPLSLPDPDGRQVSLTSFRGKVLLIEPIGLPCAACQAFAGGDSVGEFKTPDSHGVQKDLGSIETLFARFAPGARFEDDRIVYVQLLLYGTMSAAPTLEQARQWRAHFSPAWKKKQPVIMVGTPAMIGPESFAMIPGFQLVDQDFVLRFDGTGHQPKHSIFEQLLPAIPAMLAR